MTVPISFLAWIKLIKLSIQHQALKTETREMKGCIAHNRRQCRRLHFFFSPPHIDLTFGFQSQDSFRDGCLQVCGMNRSCQIPYPLFLPSRSPSFQMPWTLISLPVTWGLIFAPLSCTFVIRSSLRRSFTILINEE